MIRILASTNMKVQARPTRKSVEPIAHSIVSRYPNSFMDIADRIPMGSGHTSITNQIMARIDNYHKSERSRKRSVEALQIGAASTSTAGSATGSEYGCVSWSPPLDPCMTDKYEKSRLVLLEESRKVIRNHQEISRLMELTYPLQRKNINSNAPIESLKCDWPLLFEEVYLFQHFFTLTGKRQEDFIQNMEEKCSQIYK